MRYGVCASCFILSNILADLATAQTQTPLTQTQASRDCAKIPALERAKCIVNRRIWETIPLPSSSAQFRGHRVHTYVRHAKPPP